MVDVFISYKQEEREAVQIIASALHDLKVAVWFDTKLRAGGSFDEEIAAALNAAKAVLVCWTPAAIQSEWVRGEATAGMQGGRLAACFLQPTPLIPPFNLTHAENLCAWAGQPDAPEWIKLLERIGELIGRPGLSTYHTLAAPDVTIETLKAWANSNGDDPLVEGVWARIAVLEGEGGAERLARQQAEARIVAARRKAQAERSRRLARERGLRDPVQERRRFALLVAAVAVIGVLTAGGALYSVDAQARDRALRDDVSTTAEARTFLHNNGWHPIAARARQRLEQLDADAWRVASEDGSIEALAGYVADAEQAPQGAFLQEARDTLANAERVRNVQSVLRRLDIYEGEVSGAFDQATREAIRVFRYRWNMPVSDAIDDALMAKLDEALAWWISPTLSELRTDNTAPPTDADIMRLANEIGIDAATVMALSDVESGNYGGFGSDGRILITYYPTQFSRMTGRRFDESNPNVSSRIFRIRPSQQERWAQLEEAYALDPEAALMSTGWGRLGVLGLHHRTRGFETVGEFVRYMSQSEVNQLDATLLGFVRANNLADELQRRDWAGFARGYNGPMGVTEYAERLSAAYARASAQMDSRRRGAAPTTP